MVNYLLLSVWIIGFALVHWALFSALHRQHQQVKGVFDFRAWFQDSGTFLVPAFWFMFPLISFGLVREEIRERFKKEKGI